MDEDQILRAEERERALVDVNVHRITSLVGTDVHDGSPRDCVDCEAPIPLKRLELIPKTRRCTDCQLEFDAA
jgi:RNA polymerase-binding transcription factor DksA